MSMVKRAAGLIYDSSFMSQTATTSVMNVWMCR